MCGLPTETDEDVLAIADLASKVIETGRSVSGRRDIRCTVSIGGFVPKPHTPFQWAAQTDAETVDARLRKLRDAIRADRRYAKAIGVRYHDGKPGIIEGLLSRGDRRVGRIIEVVWADGGRFDGWSEHFSYARWAAAAEQALAGTGVDLDWYTTRERGFVEVLPWDHLDAGLDKDWLWQDWEDALDEVEVEDCRWTPCFDCGVCPDLGTDIQVGPTGRNLIPITPVGSGVALTASARGFAVRSRPEGSYPPQVASRSQPEQHAPPVQRLRIKYAKRGRARFASHRDFARAFERALRRAGVPMAYTSGYSPHPRISYANAAPTGAASEAEYLEIGLAQVADPERVRTELDAALPDGLDVLAAEVAPAGALADQLTGSRWRIDLDGMAPTCSTGPSSASSARVSRRSRG